MQKHTTGTVTNVMFVKACQSECQEARVRVEAAVQAQSRAEADAASQRQASAIKYARAQVHLDNDLLVLILDVSKIVFLACAIG